MLLPQCGGAYSIPNFKNSLLKQLGEKDLAALGRLELVTLKSREALETPGKGDKYVYFLEDGVASVVADSDGKMAVELGIIGREGTTALGTIYGDSGNPFHVFMQVPGDGYRVEAAALAAAMDGRPELRALMLRFARAFSIQVAATALANGRAKLDERLARWLLMVSDRVGPSFSITHEFISVMLGVRRSGVTLAIQILEGKHFIRASRGSITIIDRSGLIAVANGSYGFAEEHYKRLLGAKG